MIYGEFYIGSEECPFEKTADIFLYGKFIITTLYFKISNIDFKKSDLFLSEYFVQIIIYELFARVKMVLLLLIIILLILLLLLLA